MATPFDITARVTVAAEPARVWQAAVDWPGQHRWMLATRVDGGHGVGAQVTGRTGIGPAGFTDQMVITEWDPPRRCVVRHTGRLVRGLGELEVAPYGASSEFRWAEYLLLPLPAPAGRVVALALRPLAQWGLNVSLRRFARLLAPS